MTRAGDWLGSLPDHWSLTRLGALGTLVKGRGGSKEDNRESGVPVLRYGDLYSKHGFYVDRATAYVDADTATDYTNLPQGSVVFAASGESADEIGKAAMSRLKAPSVVGGDTVVLHPISAVDARFLVYVLDSHPLRSHKAIRSTGFTVVHISAGKLKTLPVPAPPLHEQRAIADYLDTETAKIDALIGKQERLIETLRERRAAVVSHVFEEVATERLQLRRLTTFLTSGSRGWGDFYAEKGERFLRIGNLPRTSLRIRGEVQFVDLPKSVTEGERTRLCEGDLLFSITAYLGSVAVVDSTLR